jgi:LDH2 family malate/lactate/ureidoglycolate dehydrogenase
VSKGDVIAAIRIEAFGPPAGSPELAAYLDLIRASGRDGGRVFVPGDRSREARARTVQSGFDVIDDVWTAVTELAETADSARAGAGHSA